MSTRPTELSSARNGNRFRQAIVAELAAGRSADAVRIFGEGLANGLAPKGEQLYPWLQKTLGKKQTAELISAYAKHACFACRGGMESCEACNGQGRWKDGTICDQCVGIGLARCAFCNGTGLVTHNAVPAGLRLHVMVKRVTLATTEMKSVLKQSVPEVSEASLARHSRNVLSSSNTWIGSWGCWRTHCCS